MRPIAIVSALGHSAEINLRTPVASLLARPFSQEKGEKVLIVPKKNSIA